MAKDKKSFILYCDLLSTVEKMPSDKAGELFLHILKYVNDLNPDTQDLIVKLTFEPIKQQLKRDLEKWESNLKQRSEAGKRSAEARKRKINEKQRSLTDVESRSTDSTVNDNVNVNVSVISNRFTPPTEEEISKHISEKDQSISPEQLKAIAEEIWLFYDAKGWMIGKTKMKSWKSAATKALKWDSVQKLKQKPKQQSYSGTMKALQDAKAWSEKNEAERNGN